METNLIKSVIERGGKIKPLAVPPELSKGTGLMNPSLFVHEGRMMVNLRGVQYIIVHSENKQKFQSRWGPLSYVHPEADQTLTTTNFFLELNGELEITRFSKVDTSKLDVEPVWSFIGLEDARLINWDNKFYMCGVRRDTKEGGEGRMELSGIVITDNEVREINRVRIEPPGDPTYCEKNWMPVVDMPFHFVKWANPTQLVKVDLKTGTSETVHLSAHRLPLGRDLRGGSSVLPYRDGHIAITHEVDLYNSELGRKDAQYYHRFIVWDKNWNIAKMSEPFKFMDAQIEFCCGLWIVGEKVYITFGFQDNVAFICEMPLSYMEELIYG